MAEAGPTEVVWVAGQQTLAAGVVLVQMVGDVWRFWCVNTGAVLP